MEEMNQLKAGLAQMIKERNKLMEKLSPEDKKLIAKFEQNYHELIRQKKYDQANDYALKFKKEIGD